MPAPAGFAPEVGAIFQTEGRQIMKKLTLNVEELEQRIAPDATGNPGNNNPPLNNTNNPGNEGTGGQVSTGGK